MTKEDEDLFRSITLPLIRNKKAKSIMNEIQPVKPLTIEEAANGRPIVHLPYKLDDFASYEGLEAYIDGKLRHGAVKAKHQIQWLEAYQTSYMGLPTDKEYYYPVNMIVVGGTEKTEDRSTIYDRPERYHICNLNLNHWDLNKVQEIVTRIKEKYVL